MTSLIIFVKNPIKGHVKTRLAATIGDDKALEVYHELMNRTQNAAKGINVNRILFYDTNIIEEDGWSSSHFIKTVQYQGDLGERMEHAFEYCFEEGSDKVVIIGSDCANLSSLHIEEAIKALDHADVVIGPSNDGGYYLLGMKRLHQSLFRNIAWSTESVYSTTCRKVSNLELSLKVLEELIDIDTEEDLVASNMLVNIAQ